jgi:hypothetical protein
MSRPENWLVPHPAEVAAEEDQNDVCEDVINALFNFLTTEPAICPTA